MADISAILHWSRRDFDDLSIEELMLWRERAIDRAELLGMLKRA